LAVNFCYDVRGGGDMNKLKKYAMYAGLGLLGSELPAYLREYINL
jgi:hypothetical protein